MKPRTAIAALVCLALAAVVGTAGSGNWELRRVVLFGGGDKADSTERASRWIGIRGASRVYIRTWTIGAAADTDFCDSVSTWKTLLSDSVCANVTGEDGFSTGSACDSVVITNNNVDSTKMVAVYGVPTVQAAKTIRASASGSGLITVVYPIAAGHGTSPAAAQVAGSTDVFATQWLRIRVTPITRSTTAGFNSTAGLRTRGFHGLRMEALIYYPNR